MVVQNLSIYDETQRKTVSAEKPLHRGGTLESPVRRRRGCRRIVVAASAAGRDARPASSTSSSAPPPSYRFREYVFIDVVR